MDAQKSQAKLIWINSELSWSVRSSISMSKVAPDRETKDLEEQKPHSKPVMSPVRSDAACFAPVIVLFVLLIYTILAFFRWDEICSSENLLLVLIFVAVFLFVVSKNQALVRKNFNFGKQLCDLYDNRLGLSRFTLKNHSEPVQWFIGKSNFSKMETKQHLSFNKTVTEGMEFYSNGDYYEGEFHEGRCNGSGVYNYIVNGRYEGDWVDGRYDGYGVESWARGSKYRGQYRQGLRHGHGVYKFCTGDAYAGEWSNGQSNGIGVQTCADGSCYIGEFKCGLKHGVGCYHFRNGDRYAGEYFADKIHGFGVYNFANGHCYEGSWHEGCKQCYGMYTFRNGETRSGDWDGSNLRDPLPPLSNLVRRASQAARKAAENAIHLRRVDDQVNRAAAAADRAASAARFAAVKAVQNKIRRNLCDANV